MSDRDALNLLALMRSVCGISYTETLRIIAEHGHNRELPF
jgi:hypothetical protein